MQLRVRAIIPSWGSQPVNPRTLAANELFTNWPGQILPAMPRGATGAKKCYIIFRLQNMASMSLFLAQSNTEKWMTPDETMFNRELRKGYSRDKQEIQYNTLRIPKNMQHNAEYVRLFWSWVVQAFDQKRYIQQMCAWICRNVLLGLTRMIICLLIPKAEGKTCEVPIFSYWLWSSKSDWFRAYLKNRKLKLMKPIQQSRLKNKRTKSTKNQFKSKTGLKEKIKSWCRELYCIVVHCSFCWGTPHSTKSRNMKLIPRFLQRSALHSLLEEFLHPSRQRY